MQLDRTDSEALDALVVAPESAPLFAEREPSSVGATVRSYFENSGFSRWTAIYGTGDIPPIWKVIRDGHQRALDQVVTWLAADRSLHTVLDAGCGTGNLAVALANAGFEVDAFDVSAPMIHFAKYMAAGRCNGITPRFQVGDIASLAGSPRTYDAVACLDVLFHYPYAEVQEMLTRLAALGNRTIVGSFALRTPGNDFWMKVGQRFHAKNRMTKLHMFTYDEVERILYRAGYRMVNKRRVKFFFYDSFVFQAVRRG